jgi:hypothetical protein
MKALENKEDEEKRIYIALRVGSWLLNTATLVNKCYIFIHY